MDLIETVVLMSQSLWSFHFPTDKNKDLFQLLYVCFVFTSMLVLLMFPVK